jgi:hypothetical protein
MANYCRAVTKSPRGTSVLLLGQLSLPFYQRPLEKERLKVELDVLIIFFQFLYFVGALKETPLINY